jgi:hypothetical protein
MIKTYELQIISRRYKTTLLDKTGYSVVDVQVPGTRGYMQQTKYSKKNNTQKNKNTHKQTVTLFPSHLKN